MSTQFICLFLASVLPAAAAQEKELESDQDKVSYLIGRNIGQTIKQDGLDLDVETLVDGLRDGLAGNESKVTEAEAEKVMAAFQARMQAEAASKAEAEGKANAVAAEEFLTNNKKREQVTTTDSGLQYEILNKGEGPKPGAADTVSVHYHGTLLDGTVFDSSVKRGQPASFAVNQVIAGWTEVLQLMPTGSKWKVVIPSELAYGKNGAGSAIGPNETLVFEIELLAIEGK